MAASGSPATPDAQGRWSAAFRVDLNAVLGAFVRGRSDPSAAFASDGSAWRASCTPDGPGTLRLAVTGDAIQAQAWGPGAGWLVDRAPALVGCGDDPTGFPSDALPASLQSTWRRYADRWRVPRSGLVFEALLISILEQKVTGVQSRRAWRALVHECGEPAPGPTPRPMRVPPGPARVRAVPSWQWHRWGVGPHQSATIMRVGQVAARLEQCADLPVDEARRRLSSVTGVGPWTVAEVSQRALGDADAVSVGDFHLPAQVVYAFTGGMAGTDEEMLRLLAPFAGHRYRVQRLVELSGITRPARGPRLTIADHRGI